MPAPIDPSFLTAGPEWQIAPVAPPEAPGAAGPVPEADGAGGGFGDVLASAIGSLETTQMEAADASRQLATGQLDDPTEAVLAVERAKLSMDFAAQVRNKAVEAYQEIFRTQV
jgi:flagellar hook-basal body complex protein FliE